MGFKLNTFWAKIKNLCNGPIILQYFNFNTKFLAYMCRKVKSKNDYFALNMLEKPLIFKWFCKISVWFSESIRNVPFDSSIIYENIFKVGGIILIAHHFSPFKCLAEEDDLPFLCELSESLEFDNFTRKIGFRVSDQIFCGKWF